MEGSVLSLGQQDAPNARTASFSGKLSWKYAPNRQAIIMGAGLTSTHTTNHAGDPNSYTTASVDLAWLASTTLDPDGATGYLGIRAGLSKPIDTPHDDDVRGTLTVGVGLELPLSRSVHGYLEFGPSAVLYPDLIPSVIGAYGLLGLGPQLGH